MVSPACGQSSQTRGAANYPVTPRASDTRPVTAVGMKPALVNLVVIPVGKRCSGWRADPSKVVHPAQKFAHVAAYEAACGRRVKPTRLCGVA